jgi:hypothetical protein
MRQWALRRRTCLASTSIDTEKTGNFDQERPSFMPPIAKHISQANHSSQPLRPCECDRLQGCGHRDEQGQEQQMQSPQRGTNFPLSTNPFVFLHLGETNLFTTDLCFRWCHLVSL